MLYIILLFVFVVVYLMMLMRNYMFERKDE